MGVIDIQGASFLSLIHNTIAGRWEKSIGIETICDF